MKIIFDYALRTGFVVAVVLATRNCGVWGDGAETEEIYNNAIVQAKPYAQQATEKLNIEMPAMPAQRQISFFGVYCYNQSVLAFFNLLNKCPHYINSFVEDMPGLFEQISQRIRNAYKEFQQKRTMEQILREQRQCIGDNCGKSPPDSELESACKCAKPKTPKQPPVGLLPSEKEGCIANQKRHCDDDIYKPRYDKPRQHELPETKCYCPKCERRESEGWSDNKPKCPKRSGGSTMITTER